MEKNGKGSIRRKSTQFDEVFDEDKELGVEDAVTSFT